MLAVVFCAPAAAHSMAHAQEPVTGAICTAAFADANGNGLREPTELPLGGVNINLSTGGAIIANTITRDDEPQHCFDRLLPGIYTLTFTENPLYRPTTASEGMVQLEAGQRLILNDFGAVPTSMSGLRAQIAAANATEDEPLERSTRLLLATGGSMMVMLFMVGVGAVILGVISGRQGRRRRRPARPDVPAPDEIAPPGISRLF